MPGWAHIWGGSPLGWALLCEGTSVPVPPGVTRCPSSVWPSSALHRGHEEEPWWDRSRSPSRGFVVCNCLLLLQNFLYKCIGTTLGACVSKDLVQKQLQELLETARYHEEAEREVRGVVPGAQPPRRALGSPRLGVAAGHGRSSCRNGQRNGGRQPAAACCQKGFLAPAASLVWGAKPAPQEMPGGAGSARVGPEGLRALLRQHLVN